MGLALCCWGRRAETRLSSKRALPKSLPQAVSQCSGLIVPICGLIFAGDFCVLPKLQKKHNAQPDNSPLPKAGLSSLKQLKFLPKEPRGRFDTGTGCWSWVRDWCLGGWGGAAGRGEARESRAAGTWGWRCWSEQPLRSNTPEVKERIMNEVLPFISSSLCHT